MNKIYLIDKEAGWTSFDVVAKMRGIMGVKKIGHAGTLDPFATGLLIVLVGKDATKRQDEYMKQDKEYEATLELGKVSTTGDPEGEISSAGASSTVAQEKIEKVLKKFIGDIEQVPPAHSAIKVNGKKAYELARKGKDVKLKSRKVIIHNIEIIGYSWSFLKIVVTCGSGTYIRSLARDIGEALETGAYLKELRRTKIGDFNAIDAVKVGDIIA